VTKALAAIVVAAAVAAIVALALRDDGGASVARPAPESLDHLRDRVERAAPALEREGVYVQTWGVEARCAYVGVVNPTAPNVAALRRRFGPGARLCIGRVSAPADACAPFRANRGPTRRRVPDLRDLGVATASRRAVAAGFSYSFECPGSGTRRALAPRRGSLEAMARVTRQRPAPGTRWPTTRPIELEAVATLPGGFTYGFSGID
jgi:hypothetical protein